ncbi:MAG: inositol monophosphatase [Bacteroidaceae bacterium]|nr:inositol monophosphatase [Bacteroidaceae bacterium]
MIHLEELTTQVRKLAIEIGAFLREESLHFQREKVQEKNAHDYVSYVDKESEKRIVSRLRELLPEAGFIAEEGSGNLTTEEYCWVVDPLDGTTNFIHQNAPFCVSIALRNREEILLGVVYEVCRDECFWAWKGSPAYLNGEEIHVTSIDNLDHAFIEIGFPYDAERFRPIVTRLIERLYGRVGGVRLLGSAAVELCYIAAGRFEARFEGLLGPWDIAAGTIILTQAGGKVTDFRGGDTFYSGHEVLASNDLIHQQLLEIIEEIQK